MVAGSDVPMRLIFESVEQIFRGASLSFPRILSHQRKPVCDTNFVFPGGSAAARGHSWILAVPLCSLAAVTRKAIPWY